MSETAEWSCGIQGCENPGTYGTYCVMHRTRIRRHGDPNSYYAMRKARPFEEVMAEYVTHRPKGECWIWSGTIDKHGYGQINRFGKGWRAHRFVYSEMVGSLPDDKILMHSCDNPPCVNPEHLTPGTRLDNNRDSVSKGRNTFGERMWSAKVNEALVISARQRYYAGEVSQRELQAELGLTPTPVSQLLRGVTWRHLPLPNGERA